MNTLHNFTVRRIDGTELDLSTLSQHLSLIHI